MILNTPNDKQLASRRVAFGPPAPPACAAGSADTPSSAAAPSGSSCAVEVCLKKPQTGDVAFGALNTQTQTLKQGRPPKKWAVDHEPDHCNWSGLLPRGIPWANKSLPFSLLIKWRSKRTNQGRQKPARRASDLFE